MVNYLVLVKETFHNEYADKIIPILQTASLDNNKVLFISFNKTYKSLLQQFEKFDINIANFHFVDTITATIIDPVPKDNCTFIKPPSSAEEFTSQTLKIIKEKQIDVIVLDSILSLGVYLSELDVSKYVTSLLAAGDLIGFSSFIFAFKTDEDTKSVKQLKMKVDKTIEVN